MIGATRIPNKGHIMQSLVAERTKLAPKSSRRRGAIAVMTAFLMIPLMGMLAFAVDYAYLLKKKTELQRAADAAALASVRELVPASNGYQDVNSVRAVVRQYARANMGNSSFSVPDGDIEIGRFQRSTVYTNFTIESSGVADTVRVTLRHDNTANSPVGLFFARVFGINTSSVTASATAILPPGSRLYPGADVLPIAVEDSFWSNWGAGYNRTIYDDGSVTNHWGHPIPGNWGTVDIGNPNNSTSDINDQILNGLRQSDLDWLYNDSRISTNQYLPTQYPWFSNADTGLSQGMKHGIQPIHGQIRMIPIYDLVSGNGNNAEYRIIKWGVVKVVTSTWGNPITVQVKKGYTYNDPHLRPHPDLSTDVGTVEGSFMKAVLVQ